jgi:hypothetical protein
MNLQHATYEKRAKYCYVVMSSNIFVLLTEVRSHKHNKGLKFAKPWGWASYSSLINLSAQNPLFA